MLVGLAAILISVCAVAVGAYEAYLQRNHDRAQVWPHLELTLTSAPTGAELQVVNAGIGPAVVRSVTVLVDGRSTTGWQDVFKRMFSQPPTRYSTSTIRERVLRAGEQVTLVALPTAQVPPDLPTRLGRVGIEVCYASVYGDVWTLRSRGLGGPTEWTEGGQCPHQDSSSPGF
ncbi:MAG TPA: hypothetical protein VGV12_15765 [Gemmatimonadales bacterium]|nr:hypothetical protein [Gemmatimonadales bacterium]